MKNLGQRIIDYLKEQNHINPNSCQINAINIIDDNINLNLTKRFLFFFKKKLPGIYICGSNGVGKSVILKALHVLYKKSEIFHFSDLIFHIQNSENNKIESLLHRKKLILIDEFFINNLTNIILFKKFLSNKSFNKKKIIMTSNKDISEIYNDPINQNLCEEIKEYLKNNFIKIKMRSRIDYRIKDKVNHNFFLIKKDFSSKSQDTLRKQLAITSIPRNIVFKRKGYQFNLENFYGNLFDVNFDVFLKKKLVFQDFKLIAKKAKFFIIRDLRQIDENEKDYIYRFISLIDAFYENKNILSISTRVKLDNLYCGKKKIFELKRTLSRLKEMGSSRYINRNLKNFILK